MANITKFKLGENIRSGSAGVFNITSNTIDLEGYAVLDTFEICDIPAGSIPLAAYVEVIENTGEACTLDIGDFGGDTDGLLDGVDINAAAGTLVQTAVGADIAGTLVYASEATLSVLVATGLTAATAGKFKVHVTLASGK